MKKIQRLSEKVEGYLNPTAFNVALFELIFSTVYMIAYNCKLTSLSSTLQMQR